MLRVGLGKISVLSEMAPPAVRQLEPEKSHRASWLAGRVLLSTLLSPACVPVIIYGPHGKPYFEENIPLWFNISHSGDDIAIVVSDEGEVGCDLEVIRPRKNVQRIAHAVFSEAEQKQLASANEAQQSSIFWRIWTRKEALLKQCGGNVWQMNTLDSHEGLFISQFCPADSLVLAVCTAFPHHLTPQDFTFSGYHSRPPTDKIIRLQ
ncbi:4'-phosphopantetheinyl transferase sfp [Phytobacter ursingii]|nr:4'-phosphopantetheinyl transferase sfp [Phytobacter ursingii]